MTYDNLYKYLKDLDTIALVGFAGFMAFMFIGAWIRGIRANKNYVPEICVCAAIRLQNQSILTGYRHDNCYKVGQAVCAAGIWVRTELHNADRGFLTSRGRFVNRQEGMRLMRASGIPSKYRADGKYRGDSLFSEDLY